MNGAEARAEREKAEKQLAAVRDRWPYITAWSRELRRVRELNHFAETIRGAFR